MRRALCAALALLVCPMAIAQHFHHPAYAFPQDDLRGSPCVKEFAPARLDPGLQKVEMHVTGTPEAKLFFSQGMTQYYGFNYEEAMRNFRAAAAADKTMAMASWGIALAAGPNINIGMDRGCRKVAVDESLKADELARDHPVTDLERSLIKALIPRYSDPADPISEAVSYSVAMGNVWRNVQDNANVGALYAESLLELRPWGLFNDCQLPALDTDWVLQVLTTARRFDPDSVGANHFWIHAIEASKTPGEGLKSADLLPKLVPESGHLVHMSSHIYLLTGDYKKSLDSNLAASKVDFEQYCFPCRGSFDDYTKNPYCPQLYYGHYASHNLFFGSVSATFLGQSEQAIRLACATRAHASRFVVNEPTLQRYLTAPLMTLVVNRNWKGILDEPPPPEDCYNQPPFKAEPGCFILRSTALWARGMAHAALGDGGQARADYDAMAVMMQKIVPPTPVGWGNNSAAAMLAIARSILKARINWKENPQEAIEHLKLAVTHEDALVYDEPPQWFTPAREALGGAYLRGRKFDLAESTFRKELEIHPESGRALYGLMRALKGKGEPYATVKDRFCAAWTYADYTMTDEDLWPARTADPVDSETYCPKPAPAPSAMTCKDLSPPACAPPK